MLFKIKIMNQTSEMIGLFEQMLLNYAHDAYWHGENTGNYGQPEPQSHIDVMDVFTMIAERLAAVEPRKKKK